MNLFKLLKQDVGLAKKLNGHFVSTCKALGFVMQENQNRIDKLLHLFW